MNVFELGTAAALAVLPFVPTKAFTACDSSMLLVETDCVSVQALDVDSQGLGVAVGGVNISSGESPDCPPIQSATITYFKEKNGEPGYQNPPDTLVGHKEAELEVASGDLQIGSFSNNPGQNGPADAWELSVNTPTGSNYFSGNF